MFKLHLISELKEAVVKLADQKADTTKTAQPPVPVPTSHKKMVLHEKKCTGCGACAKVCPADAVNISENRKYKIIDINLANCLYCGLCMEACPEEAITFIEGNELPSFNKDALHNELRIKLKRCEDCREIIGTKKVVSKTVKDLFSKGGINVGKLEWVNLCPPCKRKFQSHVLITQYIE
jgi:formate hydrogenlyase subunit 6/NADH:ubiquinone oxidoreductase subunit I